MAWTWPILQGHGARIVDGILKVTGFPMEKIATRREAIRTHMFDRIPVGPGATYLHGAAALDCLGTIGVARIIATVDTNGGDPHGPKAIMMLDDDLASVLPRRGGKCRECRSNCPSSSRT